METLFTHFPLIQIKFWSLELLTCMGAKLGLANIQNSDRRRLRRVADYKTYMERRNGEKHTVNSCIIFIHRFVATRLLGLRVRIQPGSCISAVSVVLCCQLEVSATGWSLVQGSPTVVVCGLEISKMRGSWPALGGIIKVHFLLHICQTVSQVL